MDQDEKNAMKDLDGMLLDYQYPGETGPHYVVSVQGDKLDFASPWPDGPVAARRAYAPLAGEGDRRVDYRARKMQEGLYLVHWIVKGEIHVALLFDFVKHKTTCAALMPGRTELWDEADWDRWYLPSEARKKHQG